MHAVITGAAGRLGGTVRDELRSAGHAVTAFSRAELDICDAERVITIITRLRPDAIINCSAYNAVDAAETDAATAFAINAEGPSFLAAAARASGALLVHYSTDFVFDGNTLQPYSEDDAANPLSVYGASKLAGENELRSTPRCYILRLESLFGGSGANGHRTTVDQITDTLRSGLTVSALLDRTVSPSYVADVARATRLLIDRGAPSGTYHCVNSGFTTWFDLAHEVARQLGLGGRIEPILLRDLHTAAVRPRFCAMSNHKLLELGIMMPTWQSAIGRHLMARGLLTGAHAATA
jgi:dTDP-4-dehydrorhamnose reductase